MENPEGNTTHRNAEMNLAWQLISSTGMSVFLTGNAGTGKTTFMKRLRELTPKRMVVLAPTGVAAINANGQTIHSFFQLPFGPIVPGTERAAKSYRMGKEKKSLIRSLDLLVIDEISMVRCDLLDAIDAELRKYKDHYKPFGGVQLLLIGDLQQLAPVAKPSEWEMLAPHYPTPYFFGSHALQQTQYVTVELKHIYRQQDPVFIDILARIRNNRLDQDTIEALNRRYIPSFTVPRGEEWIRLTTHNRMADDYNASRLAALPTGEVHYPAKIRGNFPESNYPAEVDLVLKEGAQVMFIKNDPSGMHQYYNGKIGIVTALTAEGIQVYSKADGSTVKVGPVEWENTKFVLDDNTKEIKEEVEGVFSQVPLRLAWAITVHKSQGLTFDHAVLDINASFAHGQTYVALSRCRSLGGLVLTSPIDARAVITDSRVNEFIAAECGKAELVKDSLPQMMTDYYLSQLDDLFGFRAISNDLAYVQRIVAEHLYRQQPALLEILNNALKPMAENILAVSVRFAKQYRALAVTSDNPVNDEAIKNRVRAGAQYFSEQLRYITKPIIDKARIPIGNKQTEKQYYNALESLLVSLNIKKIVLSKVAERGFSVKDYLADKAKAALEPPMLPDTEPRSTTQGALKVVIEDAGTRRGFMRPPSPDAYKHNEPWTREDDTQLENLFGSHYSQKAIAKQLGRTVGAISRRLKHLGLK